MILGFLFQQPKEQRQNATKIVEHFMDIVVQRHVTCSLFPHKIFKELFINTNTALPTSTLLEKVFSIEKDILKPKQTGLSDTYFEMLLFLEAND